MSHFRIAATIFIVGAGLVVSYFIVFDSTPTEIKTKTPPLADEKTPAPLQWIEQIAPSDNKEKFIGPQNNLTLTIGEVLKEQVQFSPNFLNTEKADLSTEAFLMSERLTKDAFSNNHLGLVFSVSDPDLKISSDNSNDAKVKYLKAIEEIGKKAFAGFDKYYTQVIYETYGENNPASAVQLADIYKNLADDMLNLTAPGDWLSLHKRIILSYKNAEVVYRAMADYSKDPIKGYLALEMVQSLADGMEEIQKTILAKAKEVNLY
jgi:hypothetical protein